MADRVEKEPEDIETLAGEYVVGVLDADERRRFEQLAANVTDAADARLRWENRMQGLNDSYGAVTPPAGVKQRLDQRLFPDAGKAQATGGLWQSLAFWRGFGLVGTAAAALLAVWGTNLSGELDRSRGELASASRSVQEAEQNLSAYEGEIAARGEQLAALESALEAAREEAAASSDALAGLRDALAARESELVGARAAVDTAQLELAEAKNALQEALASPQSVLVVSLESPETDYRFLAVHETGSDEVRMTRVAGEIADDRDYELWLVRPEGSTISLGVIPSGRTAVPLTPEYTALLEGGGLLAVSIEQKGGSPTGVAQGPVVAVGAPSEL